MNKSRYQDVEINKTFCYRLFVSVRLKEACDRSKA